LRARQTGDNVGIQYGLKALLAGAITPEEFVTLNQKIGGFDADANRRAPRSTADLPALDIAYRAGIVSSGANLGKLPIIDSRGFDEAPRQSGPSASTTSGAASRSVPASRRPTMAITAIR